MNVQLKMYFPPARKHDPQTSKMGERAVARRGPSQKALLLAEYVKAGAAGLTADEAGERSGLRGVGAGYWKRVSDLLRAGLIEPTGETRLGLAGELQRVCRVTADGLEVAGVSSRPDGLRGVRESVAGEVERGGRVYDEHDRRGKDRGGAIDGGVLSRCEGGSGEEVVH